MVLRLGVTNNQDSEASWRKRHKLTIRYFGDKDSPVLEYLAIVRNKLEQQGLKHGQEFRIMVHGRNERGWEKAVKLHGINRMPVVLYCVGAEERVRLEGPFTVTTYFWQSLKILRPSSVRLAKKRKVKEYELTKFLRSKKSNE